MDKTPALKIKKTIKLLKHEPHRFACRKLDLLQIILIIYKTKTFVSANKPGLLFKLVVEILLFKSIFLARLKFFLQNYI